MSEDFRQFSSAILFLLRRLVVLTRPGSSLHCRASCVVSCFPPSLSLSSSLFVFSFFSSRLEPLRSAERRPADTPRPRRVWNVGNIRRGRIQCLLGMTERRICHVLDDFACSREKFVRVRLCLSSRGRQKLDVLPSMRAICTSGKFDGAFARASEIPTVRQLRTGRIINFIYFAQAIFSGNSSVAYYR